MRLLHVQAAKPTATATPASTAKQEKGMVFGVDMSQLAVVAGPAVVATLDTPTSTIATTLGSSSSGIENPRRVATVVSTCSTLVSHSVCGMWLQPLLSLIPTRPNWSGVPR